jgi:hypothetical protein
MPTGGGVKPIFLSRFVLTPHRENPPRTQCRACAGGGDINGVWCRDCSGRGWHDATKPPPSSTRTTDIDAY